MINVVLAITFLVPGLLLVRLYGGGAHIGAYLVWVLVAVVWLAQVFSLCACSNRAGVGIRRTTLVLCAAAPVIAGGLAMLIKGVESLDRRPTAHTDAELMAVAISLAVLMAGTVISGLFNLVIISRSFSGRSVRVGLSHGALGAVVVPLLLTGLLVAVKHLSAESIDPRWSEWLDREPQVLADDENGYVFMMGFEAPAGESPVSAGARAVKEIDESRDGGHDGQRPAFVTGLGWSGDLGRLCTNAGVYVPEFDSCPEHMSGNWAEQLASGYYGMGRELDRRMRWVSEALAHNRVRIDRYRELISYREFLQVPSVPPHLFVTPYYPRAESALVLRRAVLEMHPGDDWNVDEEAWQKGLDHMTRDIRFWHTLLDSSWDALNDAIAARVLEERLRALVVALWSTIESDHRGLDGNRVEAVQQVINHFDPETLVRREGWRHEKQRLGEFLARSDIDTWHTNRGGVRPESLMLLDLFSFQRTNTMNRVAELFAREQRIANMSASELWSYLQSVSDDADWKAAGSVVSGNPFNTVGRYLVPTWGKELMACNNARFHNLEALRRLVSLAALIYREEPESEEGVMDLVEGQGPAFRNPYTGSAARFDRDEMTLSFRVLPSTTDECVADPALSRTLSIPLSPPPLEAVL